MDMDIMINWIDSYDYNDYKWTSDKVIHLIFKSSLHHGIGRFI